MTHSVFISYRTEDLAIAKLVSEHLSVLSQGGINVCLSEYMRRGSKWRSWIKQNVDAADVLLFVCASSESLTSWCSYELSRFLGRFDSDAPPKGLICLMGRGVAAPPALIDELQAVRADFEQIKEFYSDLIVNGAYTGAPILHESNVNRFYSKVDEYARQLSAAMSPVHSTEYFRGRMTITYRSGATRYTDPLIEVDARGRDLLETMGCGSDSKTLGDLKALILETPAGVWMEELEDWINGRKKQPALAPFHDSNGIVYMPIPSRMEKIDNEPAVVEILFAVTHEALSDRLELEQGDSLASAQYEIVKLLRMGRRFRYDIVEPWKQALDALTPRPRQTPERITKFKSRCLRYLNRLSQLEREGEEGKHNTYSASADTIGCLPEYLEDIWREYYEVEVRAHVENIDADLPASLAGISSALKKYRELNKKFMLIALEGYMRKVEQVKPQDLQRDDVLPQAFGGRRFSSAATADGLIGESVINFDRVDHAVARKRQDAP